MNKILLVALAAVTLFMGCSKKNNPSPTASLVSKWYLTTDTTKSYTNGKLSGTDVENRNHVDYVQFNSNGSGTELSDGVSVNFTYSVKGNQLSLSYPQQTIDGATIDAYSETGTYKVTSSSLYVYFDTSETDGGVTYRTVESSYFDK